MLHCFVYLLGYGGNSGGYGGGGGSWGGQNQGNQGGNPWDQNQGGGYGSGGGQGGYGGGGKKNVFVSILNTPETRFSEILNLIKKTQAPFFIFYSLSSLDLVNNLNLVNQRILTTTFT